MKKVFQCHVCDPFQHLWKIFSWQYKHVCLQYIRKGFSIFPFSFRYCNILVLHISRGDGNPPRVFRFGVEEKTFTEELKMTLYWGVRANEPFQHWVKLLKFTRKTRSVRKTVRFRFHFKLEVSVVPLPAFLSPALLPDRTQLPQRSLLGSQYFCNF